MAERPASKQRRASAMSDKQVAYAARDGRKVTALLPSGKEVSGYVMGMDDFHWALCTADLDVVLVHKTNAAVRIHHKATLNTETQHADIESRVKPFRDWVLKTIFNQN